ncbi:flavodoxin family protein [Lysinibacillus capsici]|uniref:flavodoxin family protein n=1 Tax=Lysinibacillus TaxID=400634 RepID=UPI000825BAD3|nr:MULTISPECIES: flavodoxin family protein [Lysinibacillus]MDP1392584.1 flavodoxin family protein [Lysinibacillus capsici]MDP1413058.1 flavodoxin family protein [Lysinibacillus capsici]MDP1428309.1 flavodoxin family protein [Lysinibacillus capsici]OCX61509.1 NAD(P)H-dependent oxidoreductase [Lysinibacillus sp. AR18-8]
MSIAVIYGGNRPDGNVDTLTKLVTQGLMVEEIYLKDFLIQPIIDKRHAEEGFSDVNDDYNSIIDRILPHDILIFSTPIYWYSMTGTMKNFIDRWSQTLRDPDYPDFKALMSSKKAYVIAVGGDEPYIKGLPMIQQFQYIFDFIGTTFEGYIVGQGNKPGDIVQDLKALSAADLLKKELAGKE